MAVIINTEPVYVSTYGGTSNAYVFRLYATLNSQSIANNTSNITVTAYAKGRNGWGYNQFTTPKDKIFVNNDEKASATVPSIPTSGAEIVLCTWTGDIAHNSDGTMTITVVASYDPNTTGYNYVPKSNSISATVTLTTIPRASEVSVNAYSITNTTGNLSYSVTSKANFYHKAIWTLNGTSTTVTLGQINTTTQNFTIRNTDLLNKLPTQTSGSVSITVKTYSDSGYATEIGENTASSTVTIDTSTIKPTVSLGNLATNTSPINNYAVRGYSTIKSSWSVSGGSGTTSRTTYVSVSHGSMRTATSTSASGTATTNTVPSSTSNYTLTMYAYAKDGRGAVSDTVSKTITVYGYEKPTATLTAYRVATSSSTTEDGGGAYVYVTFSGTVNSSVNGQNTIQSTSCTYSGSISGTATNGAHYRLADNQNVTFTLVVTDKVSSSSAVVSVQSASYPLDLYDDGQGNVGGAIGGVAPRGGFAVYVDLHLYAVRNIVIHKRNGTTETHSVSELFN